MSVKRKYDWNLIILILSAILAVVVVALCLRPGVKRALAQGEGDGATNDISSYRETLLRHGVSDVVVAPLSGSAIRSQSDGSGVEVIPIGAFRHDGNQANGWGDVFAGGYIENVISDTVCFMAPTYPPNGATLTAFSASLVDDSSSDDLYVTLWRAANTSSVIDGAEVLAVAGVAGRNSSTPVEVTDPSIASGLQVVSNAYRYYATLCMAGNNDTDLLLYGARVFYVP